jgi:2'-5' RNA ligase
MPCVGWGVSERSASRLFFALWPEPSVREPIIALLPRLAEQGGRPVAAENIHLTLAFLGQTSPAQRRFMEHWAESRAHLAFSLSLDRFGHWPGPRVLWLGPSQWPRELDTLVACLAEGMSQCGLSPDKRRYTPHVTLLRKASGMPLFLPEVNLHWQTKRFVLCESRSGEEGVRYRVLRHWDLISDH